PSFVSSRRRNPKESRALLYKPVDGRSTSPMSSGSSRLSISAVLISCLLFFSRSILSSMAEATTKPDEATVQIVYVEKPEAEEPEAFHIRTLAAVLGSEEAATDAVIYHYKHATSGFSAKLTQSQVEQLSSEFFLLCHFLFPD
ncbi:unnamed protein product, partial [Musa hybrid cultivar]